MADPQRIIEGRCPTCGGGLERRDRDGWCATCGVGWAYATTGPETATVSLTIEPDVSRLQAALDRAARPSRRATERDSSPPGDASSERSERCDAGAHDVRGEQVGQDFFGSRGVAET